MTGICDDASPETISKLVCRGCGYWEVHSANDVLVYHCGRPMVETWSDPAFLEIDRNLKLLWREIVEALRLEEILEWICRKVDRVTRRWRRTDTS